MARAGEFDEGYAASVRTSRHRLFADILGLPLEVEPNSFVTIDAFVRIAEELRVGPGDRLVDLACGRGGPGLLLSAMTGADLVGVDFSRVAVAHATGRAPLFVPDGRARFRLGDLAATGLDDQSADAVLCVDSFQFAADPDAAAREVLRILRPGGRYVQTNRQASDPHHPQARAASGAWTSPRCSAGPASLRSSSRTVRTGHVPWWPAEHNEVTLHRILVHMTTETHRHAGHADIVRELIDGATGLRAGNDNMPPIDHAWRERYRSRLDSVARKFAAS